MALLWDSAIIRTGIVFRNVLPRQLLATLGFSAFCVETEGKHATQTYQAVNSLRQ